MTDCKGCVERDATIADLTARAEAWRIMYKADCKPEVIANLSAQLDERETTIAKSREIHGGLSCDAAEEDRYGLGYGYADFQEQVKQRDATIAALEMKTITQQRTALEIMGERDQARTEVFEKDATIVRLRAELQARIAACETPGCGLTCTTDGCGLADALAEQSSQPEVGES